MSQLVSGRIPARTSCPFHSKCPMVQDETCRHKGKDHDTTFSCATARGFDILKKSEDRFPPLITLQKKA